MKKQLTSMISYAMMIVMVLMTALPANPAFAAGSGPRYPTSVSGTNWIDPTYISAADTNYATYIIPNNGTSNSLNATNYGFNIPDDATINGITVEINRMSSDDAANKSINDVTLQLLGGTGVGSNKALATDWPILMTAQSYGGAADTWGQTWTTNQINSTGFGVTISVENQSSSSTRTASLDYIRITVTYTVDVTAPIVGTVTVTPTSGSYTSSAPTITATLTEAESTVSGCEYTTNGSTWAAGVVSGATPTWTCTGSPIGLSGALTINVRGTSTGGTGIGTQVLRTVDTTAPTIGTVTVAPTSGSYTSSAPSITATLTEAESTVSGCEYTTNGSTWAAGVVSGAAPTWTCTGSPIGLSGALTINVRGTSLGGTGTGTQVLRTVDTTAPTVGIVTVAPTSGSYTSSAPSITATLTEAESTVSGCEYTTNGSTWAAGVVSGATPTWTCTGSPIGLSGALTINVRGTSLGGTGTGTQVLRTVDTTAPIVGTVTVTPTSGSYTSSAPTITATLTEAESTVSGCEYTTNGSTWAAGVVSGATPTWTCTGSPIGLSGALTINVRGTSIGGTGTGTQVLRTVDTTAPIVGTVTVTPTSGSYTSSAPTITATLTEAESTVSGCEYTTNGSTWAAGVVSGATPTWTCTGSPIGISGTLLINVRGTSLGGTGTGTQVIRIVDTTAPIVGTVTVTPTSGSHTTSEPSITATLTETESSVSGCEYTTNGSTWTAGVVSGSFPTWTCTGSPIGLSGSLTINVRGTSIGGTGTGTQVLRTVDTTAPIVGTVTVTPTSGSYTSSAPSITATLTEAESTVSGCEYTTNGSTWAAGVVSGAVPTWTCTGSPIGLSGALTINVRGTSIGGTGTGTQVLRTVDTTAPTVGTVTVTPTSGIYTSPTPSITATLTETESTVSGCEYTTNGSTWAAGVVSGAAPTWSCTGSPTGLSGALTINVRGTSVGGTGTGTQVIRVVDITAPTAAITYSVAGPYKSGTAVTITATFNETMADFPVPQITISGANTLAAADMTKSSSTVYTYVYTVGTGDGIATIGMSTGTDLAGNVVTTIPTTGATFTVDNTAPTVSIGAPSLSITNTGPVDFFITVNEANLINLLASNVILHTTGTATGTIMVLNGTIATPTVRISGITGNGTLSISIAAGIASDTAGNTTAAAGPSVTFTVDNIKPTVSIGAPSVTITNTGPVEYPITIIGADTINLLAGNIIMPNTSVHGNITVIGGTTATPIVRIDNITGNDLSWITIAPGIASDTAGNTSVEVGPSSTFTVDNIKPTVSVGSPSPAFTNTGPVDFPITINGADSIDLLAANVTLNAPGSAFGTITVLNGTTATPTVRISSITGSGSLSISIAAGIASDLAGNISAAIGPSTPFTVFDDTTAPDTTIINKPTYLDNDITPTFAFSGDDGIGSGVALFMCKMDDGVYTECTSPFTSPTLTDGWHTFYVYAVDRVANADASPASYTWTLDSLSPNIISITRTIPNPINVTSADFTVTFSKAVTGVDADDFFLTKTGHILDQAITGISGGPVVYRVRINTGVGYGTLRLDVPATATIDSAGHLLAGLPYTSGEVYIRPTFIYLPMIFR